MVDKLVLLGSYHLLIVCVGSVISGGWDIPCISFLCDKYNPINQVSPAIPHCRGGGGGVVKV